MSKVIENVELLTDGGINPETGMFEKHHCKIHKLDDELGIPPKWQFRYKDMKIIIYLVNNKFSQPNFKDSSTKTEHLEAWP